MALKILKRVQMLTVSKDGIEERKPQSIYIDSKDPAEFVIKLPDYVADALGCPADVRRERSAEVVPAYEGIIRQYLNWFRTRKAEPVILLDVSLLGMDRSAATQADRRDVDLDSFFARSSPADDEGKSMYTPIFQHWFDRVVGNTRGLTSDQQLEAAGICMQAEDNGEFVCVWHAAMVVAGNIARCQCQQCRPDIKRYA